MTLEQLYNDAINIYPEHLMNYQFKKDKIFLETLAEQINKIKPEIDSDEVLKILKEKTLENAFDIIKKINPSEKGLKDEKIEGLSKRLDDTLDYLSENHFKIDSILINIDDENLTEKLNELVSLKKHIENLQEENTSDIVQKLLEYNQSRFNKIKEEVLLYPELEEQLNKILPKQSNKIKMKR